METPPREEAAGAGRGGHTPRGEAQREALVRAAFELIAERGFEGLRTRDVAARAHVNIATLHYYFATKEDLIRAVVLMTRERFAMGRSLDGGPSGEDPLVVLRREFTDAEYQAHAMPEIFAVHYELFLRGLRDPAIRAILQDVDAHWQEHISSYLAGGVREGVFRADLDIPTTAAALITVIKGSMGQALLHGAAYPMHEVHAQVERWLMDHVLAPSGEHAHPHGHEHEHPHSREHPHDHAQTHDSAQTHDASATRRRAE